MMPGGINAAFPGGNSAPLKRGVVRGLTPGAARRNKTFLMSVDPKGFDPREAPLNFTLTLRECPATSKDWDTLKRNFFKRLRRLGMSRCHHVTEWTRKGVPHLHGMSFFHNNKMRAPKWVRDATGEEFEAINSITFVNAWLSVTEEYKTEPQAQHVRIEKNVSSAWFKYMSKHASRGVYHYQREAELIPDGWKSTGRMWGVLGKDWPVFSESHELPDWAYYPLRRQVRALRRSQALSDLAEGRRYENQEQISQALSTLSYLSSLKAITDPARSATLPISEWIDGPEVQRIIDQIFLATPPERRVETPLPSRRHHRSKGGQGGRPSIKSSLIPS